MGTIDRTGHKLYYYLMSFNVPIYKTINGAEKKRRREAEQREWESKNGPVLVRKIEKAFEEYEND